MVRTPVQVHPLSTVYVQAHPLTTVSMPGTIDHMDLIWLYIYVVGKVLGYIYKKAIWVLDDFIYIELLKFEGIYLCMDYLDFI